MTIFNINCNNNTPIWVIKLSFYFQNTESISFKTPKINYLFSVLHSEWQRSFIFAVPAVVVVQLIYGGISGLVQVIVGYGGQVIDG